MIFFRFSNLKVSRESEVQTRTKFLCGKRLLRNFLQSSKFGAWLRRAAMRPSPISTTAPPWTRWCSTNGWRCKRARPRPDTVERVKALMQQPGLRHQKSQSRAGADRRVFGATSCASTAADGSGYALLGEIVRTLDGLNAQVAGPHGGGFRLIWPLAMRPSTSDVLIWWRTLPSTITPGTSDTNTRCAAPRTLAISPAARSALTL